MITKCMVCEKELKFETDMMKKRKFKYGTLYEVIIKNKKYITFYKTDQELYFYNKKNSIKHNQKICIQQSDVTLCQHCKPLINFKLKKVWYSKKNKQFYNYKDWLIIVRGIKLKKNSMEEE